MKKFLYVTTAFYPETQISAIRNSKIAKYLAKEGYEVTVISPEFNLDKDNTTDIVLSDGKKIRNYKITHSKVYMNTLLKSRNKYLDNSYKKDPDRNGLEIISKIKEKIHANTQEIFTIVQAHDWKKQVIKFLQELDRKEEFDYVITSYPRLATLLIGEHVKRKGIAKHWILDFRDPMSYGNLNSKWYSKFYEKLQKKYCNLADIILHVSKDMKITLSQGVMDIEKFHYLPNGYDEDDQNLISESTIDLQQNSNKKRFAYVGSLYRGKRDLSIFFSTLRNLIDYGKIKEENIEFLYAGKEFSVLYNQAKRYSLEGILINYGLVSKEDSLAIQSTSDIIIVTTWNTEKDKGVIPGKIYECFLLKRPTVAIINGDIPGSELGRMVSDSGLGIEVETMNNLSMQEQHLSVFIEKIFNEDEVVKYNEEYLETFNYKFITKKLIEILSI